MLAFLGWLFVLVAGTALRGWCLSLMWGWFVVPLGAPAITYLQAAGVALLVVAMLPMRGSAADREAEGRGKKEDPVGFKKDEAHRTVARAFLAPLLFLGVGWIVHQFA